MSMIISAVVAEIFSDFSLHLCGKLRNDENNFFFSRFCDFDCLLELSLEAFLQDGDNFANIEVVMMGSHAFL